MPHTVPNPPAQRQPVNRMDVVEIRIRRGQNVGYVVDTRAGAEMDESYELWANGTQCQGLRYDANGEVEVFTLTVTNGARDIRREYVQTNGNDNTRLNAVEAKLVQFGLFPT